MHLKLFNKKLNDLIKNIYPDRDDLNKLTKNDREDLKDDLLIGKTHPELKFLESATNKKFNSIFQILRKNQLILFMFYLLCHHHQIKVFQL